MRNLLLIVPIATLLFITGVGSVGAKEIVPVSQTSIPSCIENFAISADCLLNAQNEQKQQSTADKILEAAKDERVEKLRSYFAKHKSPLEPHAQDFVYYADMYELDWKLVAAISGVESTFGKHMPKNSYNAYGWANGAYTFTSWENSIEHVSRVLREKYYNNGADTLPKIARRYAPPSKTWGGNVQFFMNQIDAVVVEKSSATAQTPQTSALASTKH